MKKGGSKPQNKIHKPSNREKIASKQELAEASTIEQIAVIEQIAQNVIAKPKKNIKHLQTIIHMIEIGSSTVACLSILTLAELFKDIAPLYKIDRGEVEKRLKTLLNKLQRAILNEELAIIDLYERYIKNTIGLSKLLDGICREERNPKKRNALSMKRDNINLAITKAFTELARNLHHFNFAKEITKFVLNFCLSKNPKIIANVQELIVYFLSSTNPAVYPFKIIVLEHFIKLMRKPKTMSLLSVEVFNSLLTIFVDDGRDFVKDEKRLDGLEKRIQFLNDRKTKGKLSKSQKKELIDLQKEKKRRKEKRKRRGLDTTQAKKALKEKLKINEATVRPEKIKKYVREVKADPGLDCSNFG